MSKEMENKLVPKMRFPGFKNDDKWKSKQLGLLAKEISEKVGARSFTLLSITSGVGLISQMEKFGREIAGSSYGNYLVIKKGDFAYNKSSTKLYPEGEIAPLETYEEGAVPNSIFTCFRFDANFILSSFIKYPFVNNIHGKWLGKFIAVGARANGALQVNSKDLFSLPILYPSLEEQQKIADCLSSLDNLITAENEKLYTLKTHKKGLMQKLFPAEGEKVPKMRFPEFKDSGEWLSKPLGRIGENLDHKRIPITGSERKKGNTPYYGASGIIDYVDGFIFDEPLLCISEDGANLIARTYPIAFSIVGRTWVNNHAHVLKFKNHFVQTLIENYLNFKNIEDFLTGMAQPKLNRGKLDIIPIPMPPNDNEVQMVALCVSTLDKQISIQSQKIEGLKLHKKGLMQQLFPNLN
jgi:type I restriction enzyme S subunit